MSWLLFRNKGTGTQAGPWQDCCRGADRETGPSLAQENRILLGKNMWRRLPCGDPICSWPLSRARAAPGAFTPEAAHVWQEKYLLAALLGSGLGWRWVLWSCRATHFQLRELRVLSPGWAAWGRADAGGQAASPQPGLETLSSWVPGPPGSPHPARASELLALGVQSAARQGLHHAAGM